MNGSDRDTELAPDERAFVARVGQLYAPPGLEPSRRAAWSAELEARIARDRRRGVRPLLAGVAVAAASLWLVWTAGTRAPEPQRAAAPAQALANGDLPSPEQALLALVSESSGDSEQALPPDYQAIGDLFL